MHNLHTEEKVTIRWEGQVHLSAPVTYVYLISQIPYRSAIEFDIGFVRWFNKAELTFVPLCEVQVQLYLYRANFCSWDNRPVGPEQTLLLCGSHHWTLSWARWIHSIPTYALSLIIGKIWSPHINVSTSLHKWHPVRSNLEFTKWLFLSGYLSEIVHEFLFLYEY